jgi:hypothetical protein
MAKGFKHGAGGTSLNFKVISNPKPETATENTIWVDTDRINNYYFSATQPENMVEYDVWFSVDITRSVEFNALKKNGIHVFPGLAKQYIGGVLIGKVASIYQNGEWIQFSADRYYLFKSGEGALVSIKTYRETSAKVSVTTDSISTSASSDGNCYASIRTEAKIDLSQYIKMCLQYTAATPEWGGNIIGVTSTAFTKGDAQPNNGVSYAATTAIGQATNVTKAVLDISAINDSLYCAFYYCGTLNVTEWWLE